MHKTLRPAPGRAKRLPHGHPSHVLPAVGAVDLRKAALRQAFAAALVLGLVALMWDRVEQLDFAHIRASLKTVSPWQWLAACGLTALSFWGLGRYDGVVHRLLGTPASKSQAEQAGIAAIAISQTVGLGVISATFVRWRMLPDASLAQAARISAIVSASFLTAWAVITSMVVVVAPALLSLGGWIYGTAWTVLTIASIAIVLSTLRPRLLVGVRLPPLRAIGAFLGLAILDMTAAGAALWVLLPDGCSLSPFVVISAYMLALGAGLISGTPGGMGAFEFTLLAALPDIGHEPLLAAVLAFRAVYFALPAVLAAILAIRGPHQAATAPVGQIGAKLRTMPAPHLPVHVTRALRMSPRAETGLLHHGRLALIEAADGTPMAMGSGCGQSLIVVSDLIDPTMCPDRALADLAQLARHGYHAPFLYKIGSRMACAARRAGWRVLPIAREATINPQQFTLDGSDKRQLRRKLRRAEAAGVNIQQGGHDLPLSDMEHIASRWSLTHGGERGFSMGVWAPATLPFAHVYLAYFQGRLVGFLTLHVNANEHTLDLMRLDETAPDGTMHALVTTAIADAKANGITRLSFAAVPLGACPRERRMFRALRLALDGACGADGLRQFKSAFAPQWETLYAAAPHSIALGIGALDVMREIHHP